MPNIVSVIGPTVFKLDFFYSGIQLYMYILLSPYLCFISFMHIDLYLVDDTSISLGSFMRTKYQSLFIHIS